LESIHTRLKDLITDISDEDFIVHGLNGLLPEYEVQVSKLEEQFGSATNPLTIQDMWNELNLKFAQLKHCGKDQSRSSPCCLP